MAYTVYLQRGNIICPFCVSVIAQEESFKMLYKYIDHHFAWLRVPSLYHSGSTSLKALYSTDHYTWKAFQNNGTELYINKKKGWCPNTVLLGFADTVICSVRSQPSQYLILYLQHQAWCPQWILLGFIFQYILKRLRASSHVTLEFRDGPAVWSVGAAARKQLAEPATVLSSGCLELLLPQSLSWGSAATPTNQNTQIQFHVSLFTWLMNSTGPESDVTATGWLDGHDGADVDR